MNRFIFVLTLGLLACGDDDTKKSETDPNNTVNNTNNVASNNTNPNNNPNNNTSNNVSSNVADALWAMLCDATFECPSPDLVALIGRYPSAQACRAAAPPPLFDFPNFDDAIARGTVIYDETKAETCLTAWQAEICEMSFVDPPAECDDVAVGTVAEGGTCLDGIECVRGLECVREGNACEGTCQKNCGAFSCTDDEICTESGCVARGAIGDSCNDFDECRRGLYCVNNTCAAGDTTPEGSACQLNGECAGDLKCIQGVCTDYQLAGPNQACAISDTPELCEPGSVCTDLALNGNELAGTCGAPKALGETCRVFYECEVGLTCDAPDVLTDGTCVALREVGQACMTAFDCETFVCEDNVCAAPATCE